jgi:hypothetical protein
MTGPAGSARWPPRGSPVHHLAVAGREHRAAVDHAGERGAGVADERASGLHRGQEPGAGGIERGLAGRALGHRPFTLPVPTMVWLSTVMIVGAVAAAVVVSGGAAAEPMEQLIKQEADQSRPGTRSEAD